MRPLQRVIDLTAGPVAGAVFGAASFVRRARSFHPDGRAFQATVDVTAGRSPGGDDGFATAGRHRAVVRLSRGAGTPERFPDFLGLAVRVLDAHGKGGHQDVLLVSSAAAPGVRHALVPARSFAGAFYSSILPYRVPGEAARVWFAARPVWTGDERDTATLDDVEAALTSGALRFQLLTADAVTPWQPVATIEVGRALGDAEAESLRFDVFNSGASLQPAGALNALRRKAVAASQATRPTPLADPTAPDRAA